MLDSKKIGKFIAMQRKQLSMTQQNIADKLDITNKAVSKWETGEGYPEISMLPALAEILEVTVDELLKGEKNNPAINVSNPYCIKDSTQQADYILRKSNMHFANNYLISIGILCMGIIASNLGLKLYDGILNSSLSYSIMISLSFLIIGIMFYINICKGFESDIEKYNSMIDRKKLDFYKITYKKHILFYAIYSIQMVILICVIPLRPFRILGYYNVHKKIFGYDTNLRRYWIDYDFCSIFTLIAYFIILCAGILIITKKISKRKVRLKTEENL